MTRAGDVGYEQSADHRAAQAWEVAAAWAAYRADCFALRRPTPRTDVTTVAELLAWLRKAADDE